MTVAFNLAYQELWIRHGRPSAFAASHPTPKASWPRSSNNHRMVSQSERNNHMGNPIQSRLPTLPRWRIVLCSCSLGFGLTCILVPPVASATSNVTRSNRSVVHVRRSMSLAYMYSRGLVVPVLQRELVVSHPVIDSRPSCRQSK